MRKLIPTSLLGSCFVVATSMLIPTDADASSYCRGWRARVFPNCQATTRNQVPRDPSVPEPGAAALFALGAGLIAARTRRSR
jgi:PEP-CTERM motif-containing protein